jgi:hypothetical protein
MNVGAQDELASPSFDHFVGGGLVPPRAIAVSALYNLLEEPTPFGAALEPISTAGYGPTLTFRGPGGVVRFVRWQGIRFLVHLVASWLKRTAPRDKFAN